MHFPLLHDITAWRGSYEYAEWEFYLNAIGFEGADVRRGHTFNRNPPDHRSGDRWHGRGDCPARCSTMSWSAAR